MSLLTRHSTRPRPVSTNIISGLRNAVIKNTGNPDGIVESHERYVDRCFSQPTCIVRMDEQDAARFATDELVCLFCPCADPAYRFLFAVEMRGRSGND